MLPDIRDYDRLIREFHWNIPARYNIGVDVCDKWATQDASRLAILNVREEPVATRVFRWPQAMAQYEVGHLTRVGVIERSLAAVPTLALAGNAYGGIGVPDCIRSGREAAKKLLAKK